MKKILNSKWLYIGFAILLLSGYVSNIITSRACEKDVAQQIVTAYLNGNKFRNEYFVNTNDSFISPGLDFSRAHEIFNTIGAGIPIANPDKPPYRWVTVSRGYSYIPFILNVEGGWMGGTLLGDGWQVTYFTFFGIKIRIYTEHVWTS
jgi:hypothetical protein